MYRRRVITPNNRDINADRLRGKRKTLRPLPRQVHSVTGYRNVVRTRT